METAHLTAHTPAPQDPIDLTDPTLYFNQELSWLAFNERVLEEAEDASHPLLERVKFLAIVSTNTDEFYMIRVAGLKEAARAGDVRRGDDGMTPSAALAEVNQRAHALAMRQRHCLFDDLLPALARQGIHVLNYDQLDADQQASLAGYYQREIFPVLTPLAVDSGHRFPFISNLSLSLLVVIADEAGPRMARVKVPSSLPRLVPVVTDSSRPTESAGSQRPVMFVWLEQIVAANIQSLFTGKEVSASYPFRVTRNADMEIQEDEAADLLESVTASLRQRPFGFVSRLTIDRTMPDDCRDWLAERLDVTPDDIYTLDGPLGMGDLMGLTKLDRPDLKDQPLAPRQPAVADDGEDIFGVLRRQDILLHHPYDSFAPVVDLVRTASMDANVLAIKQTLYRVGPNSPIVELLQGARDDDTQVAVLVELKARFDEENNIGWAKSLESHGVHVAYGLPGLKTHCKVALVVRRDRDGVRRYCHMGTGNYNAATARVYTDIGLLTSRPEVGAEASEVFNYLTGYSDKRDYATLLVSPINLRQRLGELIDREASWAKQGKPARLIFKMNQLVDGDVIRRLYRAAQAGVQIDLLVRGICCLRPGVPGLSERIRVVSIVGRFLEHSRAFYFRNGGADEVYLGSADLMPRNLDRRVEVVFPVDDPSLRAAVCDGILEVQLRDTVKARELQPDGQYVRVMPPAGEPPFSSQDWFLTQPTGTPLPRRSSREGRAALPATNGHEVAAAGT